MSSYKVNRSATTQLTNPVDYNISNLIFDEPIESVIPGNNLKMYRVKLATKNEDGTEGDLVLGLDKCRSYGINPTKDMTTGVLNGYSISLVLHDRDGPTERQQATVQVIDAIVEKCKDHLLSIKGKIKKGGLERSDLKNITPIYRKRNEDGDIDETASPMLYPKLIYGKERTDKNGKTIPAKIISKFFIEDEVDEHGNEVEANPLDYIEKKCDVTCALKIESIFIGKDIKLQCKVYEADIKAQESGYKRLLRKTGMNAASVPQVTLSGSNPLFSSSSSTNDEEDVQEEEEDKPTASASVLVASEDEEEEPVKKPVKKPAGRKAK